jgi:hypothetical protein
VFGLDHTLIRSAAERNPKNGASTPSAPGFPSSPKRKPAPTPTIFRVLPWHFMEEIQTRESDFLARGGKLIAPLPESTHSHRRPMAPTGLSRYTGVTLA